MDQRAYTEIAAIEETHWWYSARRKILNAVMSVELEDELGGGWVLDLGCGTGTNADLAVRCGRVMGIDFSYLALSYARERGAYQALLQADAERLPLSDLSFDWILALDVLEHLEDEAAAREIYRLLRPGGRVLVTVPAFAALWGVQDDLSHHRRRYTRRTLKTLLEDSGFGVDRITYMNSILFLPILLSRSLIRLLRLPVTSENTLHPRWANPILRFLFSAEGLVIPRLALPFGVSLLCVATRPAADQPC
jgi:SAM-dependent methyltransferase